MHRNRFTPVSFVLLVLVLVGCFVSFAPASIIQAIIPAAVPTPNRQGSTGTKFFICSGSFVSGNLVASDSNGNCVDSGGTGSGQPGATFFSSTTQAGPSDTAMETSVIGTVVGSKTIAANTFTNGAELQLVAQGVYTVPVAPDSLTLKIKCGSTVIGSSTIQLPARMATNLAWRLNLIITAIGTGAGGAFNTNGQVDFAPSLTTDPEVYGIVNTSNVSYDFTTSCAFDVTGTWAMATMGEALTGTNVGLWIPGAPVTSVMGQTGATNIPFTTTDISTPSAPASGKTIFYTKAGTLCAENPSAVETCTGSGGGSSNSPFVQSWNDETAGRTSIGPSAISVTAGNTVLVFVCSDGNPTSLTDGPGNTYTELVHKLNGGSNFQVSLWQTTASTTAALTINATGTTGSTCDDGQAVEIIGAKTLDATNTSSSYPQQLSIATAQSGELLIIASSEPNSACNNTGYQVWGPLAPTTIGAQYNRHDCSAWGYSIAGAAGTYLPGLVDSNGTSSAFPVIAASFQ